MKKFLHPLIALTLAATAACAPKSSSDNGAVSAKGKEAQDVSSEITLGGQSIGQVRKITPSDADLEKERERRRATSLLPVPVAPEHNASVFKVSGLADEDQYLVAPRVFVYGSKLNSLAKAQDGRVLIPFNIAIIDGLHEQLLTEDAAGHQLSIPETLRVKSYSKLKEGLGIATDSKREVGALSGCPTRITVAAAGSTFDVTPDHMKESDFCEINKPFTVQLKVPENMAQYILGDALRSNMVDLIVNYAVMVPVPTSQLSVRFNKSKLFESIKASLEANYPPYGQAELEYSIEKVLKASHMNIYIQGDYNEQMHLIVSKAIETFFTPFKLDPKAKPVSKCASMACFSVQYTKQTEDEEFSVEWSQVENMKMEKVIRIGSKLQPVNDQVVAVGRDPKIGSGQAQEFTNKNPNPTTNPSNIYVVGVTPQRGNIIEFQPSLYAWERRSRGQEVQLSARAWDDCTGRAGLDNHCSYTTRHEATYTQEYTGNDIWETVMNPLGEVQSLIPGIKAYFHFANGESMICEISGMMGYNDGKTRVIKIDNTEQCPLFDSNRKVITDFGLINGLRLDNITYTAGTKFVTDYGKDKNTYKEVTYFPEVKVAGTLKLIGVGFVSAKDLK